MESSGRKKKKKVDIVELTLKKISDQMSGLEKDILSKFNELLQTNERNLAEYYTDQISILKQQNAAAFNAARVNNTKPLFGPAKPFTDEFDEVITLFENIWVYRNVLETYSKVNQDNIVLTQEAFNRRLKEKRIELELLKKKQKEKLDNYSEFIEEYVPEFEKALEEIKKELRFESMENVFSQKHMKEKPIKNLNEDLATKTKKLKRLIELDQPSDGLNKNATPASLAPVPSKEDTNASPPSTDSPEPIKDRSITPAPLPSSKEDTNASPPSTDSFEPIKDTPITPASSSNNTGNIPVSPTLAATRFTSQSRSSNNILTPVKATPEKVQTSPGKLEELSSVNKPKINVAQNGDLILETPDDDTGLRTKIESLKQSINNKFKINTCTKSEVTSKFKSYQLEQSKDQLDDVAECIASTLKIPGFDKKFILDEYKKSQPEGKLIEEIRTFFNEQKIEDEDELMSYLENGTYIESFAKRIRTKLDKMQNNFTPKEKLEILNKTFDQILEIPNYKIFQPSLSIFFNNDISDDKKIAIRAVKKVYFDILNESIMNVKPTQIEQKQNTSPSDNKAELIESIKNHKKLIDYHWNFIRFFATNTRKSINKLLDTARKATPSSAKPQ